MNMSVWTDTAAAPEFGELEGDIECEALVIGGGLAGILIAHFLKERGVDVVVAEAKKIGQGVTKNTTAVITAQHDTLYSKLSKKHGLKKTKQYLEANLYAVEAFKKMAAEAAPDCDFEIKPSVMYSRTDKKTMQKEAAFLKRLGFEAEFVTDIPLPVSVAGGVKFGGMAQFHPLKFLYALAKDLKIYENTFITDVKSDTAYTKEHKIKAKNIIFASHFPFVNRRGFYFVKMFQKRSYVLALNVDRDLYGTYVSHDDDGLYLRNYKDLLLVGGVDRRTGKKTDCGYDNVRKYAHELFPGAEEKYIFAAQDCATLDAVPYIGKYCRKKNWFVATGFNEWGMTASMISARIISDMITGGKNDFSGVFCPQRRWLRRRLLVNLGTVVLNFLKPSLKRCPHLGCSLRYNRKEKTWECPCHGSRFNEKGALIDNPAMKDANV